MDSQRPKRHIKKPSRYSQSPPPISLNPRKPAIPDVHRPQKRPLQAILVKPIPADLAASLPSRKRLIPLYTPPLGYIEYKAGLGVCKALDEFSTFLLLFSEACVDQIVAATNSYAERDQDELHYDFPRQWTPITRLDLLHYISCLFYMGMHKETLRGDYWSPPSRLGDVIGKTRFDQICRYLHIRDK